MSATLLFLLPALLLGMLSPYAVKLQSVHFPEAGVGSVAGSIFFWSTLGSIAGSLSAGFVLIPHFGIDRILITNGVVLSVLGLAPLLFLGLGKRSLSASLLAFAVLLTAACFAAAHSQRQVLYTRDGVYQKITIYDGEYAGRPARFFQQDENNAGAGEGAMFLDSDDPADLVYDYTRYYSLYKIFQPSVKNALVIGGGAYSVPKALLRELPEVSVDVVDIEPSLLSLAQRYFKVPANPRLHSYVEDGRRFLRDSGKQYDLIFSDVYYSFFSVPPHFGTREFFELAKRKLSPNGIFVANMIGDLSRQQPSLILAEIKTFQTVFPNRYFFAVSWPERTDSQNVMLVGYNSDTRVDFNSSSIAANRDPLIRLLPSKLIDVEHRFELSPYPILTDDFAPVEFLTAQVLRRAFANPNPVDGDEMLADVAQQTRYQAGFAAPQAHQKTRDFLLAEMNLLAEDVKTQNWAHTGPDGKAYELTNIVGHFFTSDRRVVVATHYDGSRGGATGSVSGLGDASGAAVLVELARGFGDSNLPPDVGIDLVFLDGTGWANGSSAPARDSLGSAYFADHLGELYAGRKPVAAIIVDDVCDRNLRILKEPSAVRDAPALVKSLFDTGEHVDGRIFEDRLGPEIEDDQAPLIQAGIPTALLVDTKFASFGAGGEGAAKCSARSMAAVGQTLLNYVTLAAQPSDP